MALSMDIAIDIATDIAIDIATDIVMDITIDITIGYFARISRKEPHPVGLLAQEVSHIPWSISLS